MLLYSKVRPLFAIAAMARVGGGVQNLQALTSTPHDLKLLSNDAFAVLIHPALPRHSVRIKKSDFCDSTVTAYTGYIDIEARHLFFYFFESRSEPDEDDVIFWTNGGPGGSSSSGLLMELGPCNIVNSSSTEHNPYGWNDKANIFFIDQPIGVGFSYADYGEMVSTTEEAAVDIAAFVAIFFEHFRKFTGKSFHMAGESFGGRYLPLFAAAILDQNSRLIEYGIPPVNLTSVMIGNGLTNYLGMLQSYYDMKCTPASLPPVESISACVRMKQALPRCYKTMKEACFDVLDSIGCEASLAFCESELGYVPAGLNPYDLSKKCEGTLMDTLCYPITRDIVAYLNTPDIRALLGTDPTPENYSSVNFELNGRFMSHLDHIGVRCPPLREWNVDGAVAGLTRSAGPLTFATIYGAGHMVPHDMPKESLELVNRWIAQEPL
ncbi:Alpha/Beta hydrolase protein [Fomitopsis serialis]|uniref:Alpha/Beta hydrolase protein n=1 Tax=Fomitopsis serialis TaxID=139415 RepID=UPI002008251D|nr:Alpha/Beta hydrolase protein [Neoantrodia serialis]KAH9934971.1 Alpha/Beta hydrolase protein [Neoantrodia serialis]